MTTGLLADTHEKQLRQHRLVDNPAVGRCAEAGFPPPPNVIVILADDLGWHGIGSYGNRFNETPHLDKLAAVGQRFPQAYAIACKLGSPII